MLDQIVQDIRHKGWSYWEEVIDSDRLKQIGPLFEGEFAPARVGKDQRLHRNEEIRGDWTQWLDPARPAAELSSEMILLDALKRHLNQHLYLGLKDFECHLAKYPIGSFYQKHKDRFEKDSSRSISFIFYLHEEWHDSDGGELVLYNGNDEAEKVFLPLPGSVIFFLSEDFPHEVKKCHRERRSLTGWMHTKNLY